MFADRRHWSFSAINQYLRCPLQYYFERVLKLPQPTVSSGLVLGSAVHAALSDYHLNLQRRTPTTIDKLQRIVLVYWTLREAERPIQYKAGENRVVQLATAIGLLETYLKQPPPEGIVGVEQRLLVPLVNSSGEYLETPLAAVVDLLTRDDHQLKVREFKTSGRAYGDMEVETSLQATSYVNAVWQTYGEWAAVEYNILIKTKTPKVPAINHRPWRIGRRSIGGHRRERRTSGRSKNLLPHRVAAQLLDLSLPPALFAVEAATESRATP